VIADLPSTVPWQSAVLVVRKTLDAAGVKLSEVDASARALESKLSSEIELAQDRQKEFREKTQETVRSLEEEIRKAREACEDVVAYEERKISRDRARLEKARRVRAFFEFPDTEGEDTDPAEQGTQQLLEPSDVERRQISDTPSHPGGSGQEL
jgi:Zn-dependent M32 family carboxypeptidase